MNSYLVAAGLIFLISIIGSRFINERGLKLLTNEQKGLLVKVFSELFIYQLVFLGVLVITYIGLAKFFPERGLLLMMGYLVVLFIFMFIHGYVITKKLSQYGLPKSYSRYYVMSTFLKTGGMLIAMATLFLTMKQGA